MPEQQLTFAEAVDMPAAVSPTPERNIPVCSSCVHEIEDLQPGIGESSAALYCPTCFQERYIRCVACQHTSERADARYDTVSVGENRGPYCTHCFNARFRVCDGCTHYMRTETTNMREVNGRNYCDTCYNDRFVECSGCNHTIPLDAVAYTDEYDGDCYCRECAPDDENDDGAEWHQGERVHGVTFAKTGSSRRFGVELEISGCNNHAALRNNTVFGVKYDGSLTSGKEFVSPILHGDEGLQAVENLCEFGRTNNWSVDNSCGYHLHLDFNDVPDAHVRAVIIGYLLTENLWKRFVSKQRAKNTYCKGGMGGLGVRDIARHNLNWLMENSHDRYQWFNWQSYRTHHTLEIRLHSGTTNAVKVNNWVKAHLRFADHLAGMTTDDVIAKFEGKSEYEQFRSIADIWGDPALVEYYRKRAKKHGQEILEPEIQPVAAPPTAKYKKKYAEI